MNCDICNTKFDLTKFYKHTLNTIQCSYCKHGYFYSTYFIENCPTCNRAMNREEQMVCNNGCRTAVCNHCKKECHMTFPSVSKQQLNIGHNPRCGE